MKQLVWMFGLLAMGAMLVGVGTSAAAPAIAYHELIDGNPKAKITMIEFASLTCPHCAEFQQITFPLIKKNYIDTGKIRYVFKDYPIDELAMVGAVLARCAPADRGLKLIDTMFKNQLDWARADKPIVPLKGYAQLAGMSSTDVDACLQNKELLQSIKDEQNKATTLYQIEKTPTFYIGDERVEGAYPYSDFVKIIDKQIAKTK